jgi:hypothetical protein
VADLIARPDTPLTCQAKARILRQLGIAQERFAAIASATVAASEGRGSQLGNLDLAHHAARRRRVSAVQVRQPEALARSRGILFGFYLASSSVAPEIRTTVTSIIHALTGQG